MIKLKVDFDDFREWQILFLIASLISILYLALICVDSTPKIMEARNLVAARECIVDGHWLIPTMNGAPRVRKPPLPTWVAAVSMIAAKDKSSLFAGRLPSIAMISLTGIFTYFLARDWLNRSYSAFSSLIMTTSGVMLNVGRLATWDIFAFTFAVGGLWMLTVAMKGDKKNVVWSMGASLLWGLSFLSKGPVSLYTVFLPFLASLVIMYGVKHIRWRVVLPVLVISTAIGASWWLYVYLKYHDVLKISAEEADAWGSRHVRSFLFYLQFPIFIFPWTPSFIGALAIVFTGRKTPSDNDRRSMLFFLLWFAVVLVLLSLVPEKKDRYFIPTLIPVSFAISLFWKKIKEKTMSGMPYYIYAFQKLQAAALSFAVVGAVLYFAFAGGHPSLLPAALPLTVLGVMLLREKHPDTFMVIASVIIIASGATVIAKTGYADKNIDLKGIAKIRELVGEKELYLYGKRDEKVTWLVQRRHKVLTNEVMLETLPALVLVDDTRVNEFKEWCMSKDISFKESYRLRYSSVSEWIILFDISRAHIF